MIQKVLVPLDGSKRAEAILPHIQALAACMRSQIVLIAVVEPILTPVTSEVIMYAEDMTQHRHEMRSYLEGIAKALRAQGVEVETCVTLGQPVHEIVETARRVDADLIAMSSHGRTGLARVFYGSVAAGVLHQIDRPLLLVRADDRD